MKRIANFLALCLFAGCAGSSAHLVAPALPPINPAEVRIYHYPPRHYEEIAVLDATSGPRFFHGTAEGEVEVLHRLQEEAARVGANGILLTSVGDRPSGAIGLGVGGETLSSGHRTLEAGEGTLSGAAPLVRNGAAGIAIHVAE
jgi:hypothetical protein